jgi:hypothetical protein
MALLAQVQPNECDPKEHFQKKGILTTTTEREFQNALWTRSQTLFLRLFFFFFLSTSFPFWPEAASSYLSLPTLYNLPPPPWFAHSAFARHIHQVSFWYRQERKSLHPFSRTMCAGGGGSWSIKNMILAREERGQHACIARWFLFIIPLIITYPKERNERIEKRIRPKPFAPPGTPSGLWRYAQFVFIIENETRRGS